MKSAVLAALAAASLVAAGAATAALSAGDQFNLEQIRSGSPGGIRAASQNIEAAHAAPIEVTDALAEMLLKNQTQNSNSFVDALSWACKALAATGNKRYYTTLKQIDDNAQAHKKTRKYCGNAAEALGGADGEQYAPGMAASSVAAPAAKGGGAAAVTTAGDGSFKPITEVKPEMSQQQAFAIAGPPTSSNAHVTGKAWIPFNFKGSDSYRTIAHYKGQGRIIFSNTSAYSTGQRVLEVQIDPNETGY